MTTSVAPSIAVIWQQIDELKAHIHTLWPAGWPTPARIWPFDAVAKATVLLPPDATDTAVQALPWLPLVKLPALNGYRFKMASRQFDYEREISSDGGILIPLTGANVAGEFLGSYLQGYVQLKDMLLCV